jgi:hypothetical protein
MQRSINIKVVNKAQSWFGVWRRFVNDSQVENIKHAERIANDNATCDDNHVVTKTMLVNTPVKRV